MILLLPTPVPVDVSNWPAPSPQWPTLVLSGASLVVALAALVVAVATLRFTKQAWEREGAVLDINFVFFYWGHEEAPLRDHAEFRFSIKNVGRTMTEIRTITIATINSDGSEGSILSFNGKYLLGDQNQLAGGQIVERSLDPKKLPSTVPKVFASDTVDMVIEVRHTFGVDRQSIPDYGVKGLQQFISRDGD
ncbi:hypothetical protein [Corynebacterium ureicelerivorans]|uniref:Uncharacterized protein n=1 Tax=Corynebacterium ureicelerivorans TaxID=401472 RepID=A0A077HJY3_9CORY|nr:hypothetical protein [Corynebacterium ureicelerivorans]AIL96484.1 hypothetical protein CUREI_03515 [Corynebacterium ureicelerivorans]